MKQKTEIAFYFEWLSLDKPEFRILAMLADKGGTFQGNLTNLHSYFSSSTLGTRTRRKYRCSLEHLSKTNYIELKKISNTYTLSLVPKEKPIQITTEQYNQLRCKDTYSRSVSWEAVLKVYLWLNYSIIRGKDLFTNREIKDCLSISKDTIIQAKKVLENDLGFIFIDTHREVSGEPTDPFFTTLGQEVTFRINFTD